MSVERLPRSLASIAVTAVAALLSLAPSVVDFHVLRAAHREAHVLASSTPEKPRQEACTHGAARHVEAGSPNLEAPDCGLCNRRAGAQSLPQIGAAAVCLLAAGRPIATGQASVAHLTAFEQLSRGPPRA